MRPLIYLSLFFFLFSIGCKENPTALAEKPKGPAGTMAVQGIIAQKMVRSENIKTTGTVLPGEKLEVKSEISGRITNLYFNEGSPVQKGQILVKLDDAPLQAEKKKMKLQIELESIKEKRQKQLLAAKAISQEEYDLTEANLNILKSNIDIIDAQIIKTTIRAPFSGKAGFRDISTGAMITPNDVITVIHSLNPLKLECKIPEKLSGDIKTGKEIEFQLVSEKHPRRASVYAIDPQINPDSRSIVLRAKFQNPKYDVLPGSFADITIPGGTKNEYISIPSMAYVPDISGALVYLKKNGSVTPSRVIAASRSEKEVFIESGIEPGDTVITTGLLQIKPGMPVSVTILENK